MDLPHAIQAGELLVEDAGQQHQAVSLHRRITNTGNFANNFMVEQSVNHVMEITVYRVQPAMFLSAARWPHRLPRKS